MVDHSVDATDVAAHLFPLLLWSLVLVAIVAGWRTRPRDRRASSVAITPAERQRWVSPTERSSVSSAERWAAVDAVTDGVVLLRPLAAADVPAVASCIDDEVLQTSGLPPEHVAEVLHFGDDALARRRSGTFTVVDVERDLVVGSATLTDHPDGVHIGLSLGPDGRGRGFGRRVVVALCDIAGRQGVAHVLGGTAEGNLAMQRVFEQVGAEQIGNGPIQLPDGSMIESCWYRLSTAVDRGDAAGAAFRPAASTQGR